jgi:hypothetical protein
MMQNQIAIYVTHPDNTQTNVDLSKLPRPNFLQEKLQCYSASYPQPNTCYPEHQQKSNNRNPFVDQPSYVSRKKEIDSNESEQQTSLIHAIFSILSNEQLIGKEFDQCSEVGFFDDMRKILSNNSQPGGISYLLVAITFLQQHDLLTIASYHKIISMPNETKLKYCVLLEKLAGYFNSVEKLPKRDQQEIIKLDLRELVMMNSIFRDCQKNKPAGQHILEAVYQELSQDYYQENYAAQIFCEILQELVDYHPKKRSAEILTKENFSKTTFFHSAPIPIPGSLSSNYFQIAEKRGAIAQKQL